MSMKYDEYSEIDNNYFVGNISIQDRVGYCKYTYI